MSTGGGADATVYMGLDATGYKQAADELIRYTQRIEQEQLKAGRAIEDFEARGAQRRADVARQLAQEQSRIQQRLEADALKTVRAIEAYEARSAQRQIEVGELLAAGKMAQFDQVVAAEAADLKRTEQLAAASAQRQEQIIAASEQRIAGIKDAATAKEISDQKQIDRAIEDSARRQEQLAAQHQQRMDAIQDAAAARMGRQVPGGVPGAPGASGAFRGGAGAQGLLQLSYAVQDFQAAGIRGMLNNIPLLTASLGLGAGLAGAFQLVGVAVAVLEPQIRQFIDAIRPQPVNVFGDSIESLQRRLEQLTRREYRLEIDSSAVDAARDKFRAAEEAAKAFEAISSKRTVEQVESGQRVTSAVANLAETATATGGLNLQRAIRDQLVNSPEARAVMAQAQQALAVAQQAQRAAPGAPGLADAVAAAEGRILTERQRIQAEAETRAADIIGGASAGQEQRLLELIQTLQGNQAFFASRGVEVEKLIPALQGARPGGIAAEQQAEAEAEAQQAADRVREAVDRALAAEQKRIEKEGGEDPRGRFRIDFRQAMMQEGAAEAFQDPVFARDVALRLQELEKGGGGLPGQLPFQPGDAGPAAPGVIPIPVPIPVGADNVEPYMRQAQALFDSLKAVSGAPAGAVPMQPIAPPPRGGVNR